MKEAGKALRQAFFAALNGVITVPVFDMKVEGTVSTYVLLNVTSDIDQSNKSRFAVETNLNVDIIDVRNSSAKSEVLEDISNAVLQIILPSPQTFGGTIASPFSVTFCRLDRTELAAVEKLQNEKFVHAKRLTFKNRITQ